MKYFIRAIKYYFYFVIMLVVIMAILVFLGMADGNIETMFKDGYNSLWKIAIMFAVIAGVYPAIGFIKKDAMVPGEWKEIAPEITAYMEEKGYVKETETDQILTFRNRSVARKITNMYEDRITMTPTFGGVKVEGLRKDVIRLIMGIENRFRKESTNTEE